MATKLVSGSRRGNRKERKEKYRKEKEEKGKFSCNRMLCTW